MRALAMGVLSLLLTLTACSRTGFDPAMNKTALEAYNHLAKGESGALTRMMVSSKMGSHWQDTLEEMWLSIPQERPKSVGLVGWRVIYSVRLGYPVTLIQHLYRYTDRDILASVSIRADRWPKDQRLNGFHIDVNLKPNHQGTPPPRLGQES